MKTQDLIRALAADTSTSAAPMARIWSLAVVGAAALAAIVFLLTIGPRPDIAAAAETVRFVAKPVLTMTLAMAALVAIGALSRPVPVRRTALAWLAAVPVLMGAAVALELAAVPSEQWRARLVGTNSMVCLTYIPLIGAGPLLLFLLALRHGAPGRPAIAGAVAGLLAGGIAATFYAMHCPDDSPLFVATWYTIAVAGLAAIGAAFAPCIARW